MKIGKYLGMLLVLLISGSAWAQQDTLPHIVSGRLNWEPYRSQQPSRMNQKDYAIYMVRMNGLDEWFETEPDQDWIQDFHFFDVNKDRIPDAVYSGSSAYFKGDQSLFLFGDSSFKYPLTFSAPGYIHRFDQQAEGIEVTLVKEPAGSEFLVHNRHYYYAYEADSAKLMWQLQYISTTQIPPVFAQKEAFTLRLPTHIRTTPEVRNEPGIDYNGDQSIDGLGNIVAEIQPGIQLFRLLREDHAGESWSFVMLLEAPAGQSLFLPQENAPINGYCGWIPSSALED